MQRHTSSDRGVLSSPLWRYKSFEKFGRTLVHVKDGGTGIMRAWLLRTTLGRFHGTSTKSRPPYDMPKSHFKKIIFTFGGSKKNCSQAILKKSVWLFLLFGTHTHNIMCKGIYFKVIPSGKCVRSGCASVLWYLYPLHACIYGRRVGCKKWQYPSEFNVGILLKSHLYGKCSCDLRKFLISEQTGIPV